MSPDWMCYKISYMHLSKIEYLQYQSVKQAKNFHFCIFLSKGGSPEGHWPFGGDF